MSGLSSFLVMLREAVGKLQLSGPLSSLDVKQHIDWGIASAKSTRKSRLQATIGEFQFVKS